MEFFLIRPLIQADNRNDFLVCIDETVTSLYMLLHNVCVLYKIYMCANSYRCLICLASYRRSKSH